MTELAKEYGEGLYALGKDEGLCDQLLSEMDTISACFRESPDYVHLLSNLSISKTERTEILDKTFRNQVHPYLLNFLKILCDRGCISDYQECLSAFRTCFYKDGRIADATVTTVAPLTAEQKNTLIQKLEAKSGKKVILREKVDASIIEGVLLEMDGVRIDGTLRHRLTEIQNLIANEA